MMHAKKRKGMTLIEIVVAMGVAAIMALLVVQIMAAVNATMKATTNLNKRLAHESKYADNLMTADDSGSFDFGNGAAIIHMKNASGAYVGSGITALGTAYETHYADPSDPLNFIDGANYRFMSFDKTEVTSPIRSSVFWITIVLTDDLATADAITSIDIIGNSFDINDGTTPKTSQSLTAYNGTNLNTITGKYETMLKFAVPAPPLSADGKGKVKLVFHKNMVGSLGGTYNDYAYFPVEIEFCTLTKSLDGSKISYFTDAFYGFTGTAIDTDPKDSHNNHYNLGMSD